MVYNNIWLVVDLPLWKMMEWVRQWGWDDIPYMKWPTRHVWAHLTPITLRTRLCRTDCTKNGEQSVKHCHYVQFSNEPMEVRSSFRTEQKAMILLVAHKSHPRTLSASGFSCNYTSIYILLYIYCYTWSSLLDHPNIIHHNILGLSMYMPTRVFHAATACHC
jgi:hypothetical protein